MSDSEPLATDLAAQAAEIRAFNRFYTRRIGVLDERLMASPYTLTQMRVLYELGHGGEQTAQALRTALGLDAGYLSRILGGFEKEGVAARRPDPSDGRQALVDLTEAGRATLAPWERASTEEMARLIAPLEPGARAELASAMATIERLLGPEPATTPELRLRRHRPGDMGWIVSRQAVLYAEEYGWDQDYEALAAEITAEFLRSYDPERERCWIAELGGAPAGAVFLVKAGEETAKLRLLHVEKAARGRGVGRRLVGECVETARALGYSELVLWTNAVLADARRLYQSFGFELVDEALHESFGQELLGQNWRLAL